MHECLWICGFACVRVCVCINENICVHVFVCGWCDYLFVCVHVCMHELCVCKWEELGFNSTLVWFEAYILMLYSLKKKKSKWYFCLTLRSAESFYVHRLPQLNKEKIHRGIFHWQIQRFLWKVDIRRVGSCDKFYVRSSWQARRRRRAAGRTQYRNNTFMYISSFHQKISFWYILPSFHMR